MKRWHVLFPPLLAIAALAPAAERPRDNVVQLPAFVVDGGNTDPVQWLRAEVAGVEILSCLSPADTNWVVNALREQSRLYAWVLPAEMRAPPVRLAQLVLDDRPLTTLRLSLRSSPSARDALNARPPAIIGLALHHGDFSSTYLNSSAARSSIFSGNQVDLAKFGASVIGTTTLAVLQRSPRPAWLVPFWSAATDVYARGDNVMLNRRREAETAKSSPPKNLPLPSLALALADPSWQPAPRTPTHATAAEAGGWFVRWALYSDQGAHRASFWNFVQANTLQPLVDDDLIRQHFGLSLAELDATIEKFRAESDAVPERRLPLPLGLAPIAAATRAATPVETARFLGQWTLLALRENPEYVGRLSAAGRRLLERARESHRDDPRLAALLGLIELEAGQPETARALLESAADFPELDARTRFELARLRSVEALATPAGAGGKLAARQVASILAPLATFRIKPPGSPEPLALIAQTWLQAAEKPSREELAEFTRLARRYPRHIEILFPVAQLCYAQNLDQEAQELTQIALEFAQPEPAVRASLIELKTQIRARVGEKK